MIQRAMTIFLSIVATLAISGRLAAQAPPFAQYPLEPLAWLVGGTWVAETKTPDGNSRTIESKWSTLTRRVSEGIGSWPLPTRRVST